jgi:hypothetical protein
VLAACRYAPLTPYLLDVLPEVVKHLPLFVKGGAAGIEIHWNITDLFQTYSIDPSDLWRQPVPFRVGDTHALGLGTEHLILHLCAHASYQHRFEFGLRPFCDVAETIRRHGDVIDWPLLATQARQWRWSRGIAATLELARDFVGAEVPDSLLDALAPAPMAPKIRRAAVDQVFTVDQQTDLPGKDLARLGSSEGIWTRLRHGWRRVFLPRLELASHYGAESDTARHVVAYLYARRIAELVRRHGRTIVRLMTRRDVPLNRAAQRKNELATWLLRS